MFLFKRFFTFIFLFALFFSNANFLFAQIETKSAQIYISPKVGSFLVGSTFDVSVYLDTQGNSANTVGLKVNFDPKKLSVANPSGGKSIFGIWVEPPTYDNTKGEINLSGVITEGIVTSSGLITTISFKAISSGEAKVSVSKDSTVYLNDGLGTKMKVATGVANLTLKNPQSEGLTISSETHPFSENWYNNNNPIFSWESLKESEGYAILIDSNPKTFPVNEVTTTNNTISYNALADGIWYFHIKSKEGEGWSNTSHYQFKIDTTAPLAFEPEVRTIINENKNENLLIFSTTDTLSGIDHYEVGVLDSARDPNALPVFVQSTSPYVLPAGEIKDLKIIVKAFDNAGNVTEAYANERTDYRNIYIFLGLGILLVLFLLHYLFGHHVLHHIGRAYRFFQKISDKK